MMSRAVVPHQRRAGSRMSSALDHVGVDASRWSTRTTSSTPCVHDSPRSMACSSGVNPIHQVRNRAKLDALLREMSASGVSVSAHPDVILNGHQGIAPSDPHDELGLRHRSLSNSEAMRAELPSRLAAGPRVIKRNRGNGDRRLESRDIGKFTRPADATRA